MAHKGYLLATVGGVAAAAAGGAHAADMGMPVKAPPPAPAQVASWTGFYLGLHAGADWQEATATPSYGYAANRGYGLGFIGGAQVGYNWQVNNYVVGLEATISGLSNKATMPCGCDSAGKGNSLEAQIKWLSTFRGRAGWLMNPDTLLYVTGGLAVGGVKDNFDPNGLHGDVNSQKSASKTKAGWVIGGGMEHMLDKKWSVAVEASYVDLGNTSSGVTPTGKSGSFKNSLVITELKLNYKW